MNKVVCYILILSILVSICFIPVSGAVTDGLLCDDLLVSDFIYTFDGYNGFTYTGQFYVQSEQIEMNWSVFSSTEYDFVTMTFFCPGGKPTYVNLDFGNGWIEADYIGGYNDFYQYRISNPGAFNSIELYVDFNSGYDNYFAVVEFNGYRNISEPVLGCNVYPSRYYRGSQGELVYDHLPTVTITEFPRSLTDQGDFSVWYYNLIHIDVPPSRLVFDSYDSLTFDLSLFMPYSVSTDSELLSIDFWNDKIGFSLFESGKEVLSIDPEISTSIRFGPITAINGSLTTSEFCAILLTVTIDLNGIDLANRTPDLNIQIPPLLDPGSDDGFVWVAINSIYLTPVVKDLPWYTRIVTFLGNSFDQVKGSIQSAGAQLGNWWSAVRGQFSSWFSAITNGLSSVRTTIVTWGENIVAALTPDDPDLPDVEDQLATDASKFHDEMDVIETVPKPSIDPGDLPGSIIIDPPDPFDPEATEDTQGYVDPSDPAGTDIMTTLTSAPNFFPAVTIVLTIAIVSLLLYGVGG